MHQTLRRAILAITASQAPETVAAAACAAMAQPGLVLARVWLVADEGDLRLAASAGSPTGGGSYHRVDGEFSRIIRGTGKIGRIAASGAAVVVHELRGDEEWLANPGWVARQGVRSFAGLPIACGGEVLGVAALFSRHPVASEFIDDLSFVAEVTAVRLVALRRAQENAEEVVTRSNLRAIEKQSIEAALRRSGGKVFGRNGAAEILGMRPTTLASRLKALGIAPR